MIDISIEWMMEVEEVYRQCKTAEDVEEVTKRMILYLEAKEDINTKYLQMGMKL